MHFLYLPDIRAIIRRNYERTGRTGLQTFWRYQAVRGGRVLEESPRFMPNIFHDDGEELVCKIVFDETVTVPASYYIGLDNRASLAEADALSGMTSAEEDGTGYARQAVASNNTDFTVSQDGGTGDWQALTKTVTFTASGADWQSNLNCFCTDQASAQTGKYLISSVALSQARLLGNGDSVNVSMIFRVREAA